MRVVGGASLATLLLTRCSLHKAAVEYFLVKFIIKTHNRLAPSLEIGGNVLDGEKAEAYDELVFIRIHEPSERELILPVSIEIADHGLGVVLIASEYLSTQDVLDANLDFFNQYAQEFLSCRYWLADYSQVEDSDADFTQIQRLASIHVNASKTNPQLVVAVYGSKDFVFGMARMWEMLAEATGWQTGVFRSAEEAKAWIRSQVNESLTFQ
jgi:hypothetical protein